MKEPVDKKAIFSMIASKNNEGWLSARGQGGELILWNKD